MSVNTCTYDVIILTETWLTTDYADGELELKDYNIYRADRNSEVTQKFRGGGALIAIRKSLKSHLILSYANLFEQLFVSLMDRNKQIILGAVYIPPAACNNVYKEHCLTVEQMMESYSPTKVFLCGDYNIPETTWSNNEIGISVDGPLNPNTNTLSHYLGYYNFYQMNTIPNSRGVLLDLVFTLSNNVIVRPAYDLLLPNCAHHSAITFEINVEVTKNTLDYEEYFYDYKNADYLGINNYLASINWDIILYQDINNSTNNFYNILSSVIDLFVPLKKYKTSNFPRWFSAELRRLTIEKKNVHIIYKKYGRDKDYYKFSQLRSQCKALSKTCYQTYLYNMENSINSNPRAFWTYINDHKKTYSLPNILRYNGETSNTGLEAANLFADFFSTVYTLNNNPRVPNYNFDKTINLTSCPIELSSVFQCIENLKSKLSYGPDGIPAFFLKNCVYTISRPLHILFNLSINSGTFPNYWKHSFLSPIFKSGSKEDIENYRGICMQSEIPKMFDLLVTNHMTWVTGKLIVNEQHGFIKGRSTNTNLLLYQNYILECLESKLQVDSIYTDFSKAFDRVDHELLIAKLKALGIDGQLLNWLSSFLTGRTQSVRIGSFISKNIEVLSGVPQGSHCAPLLFNLFINDIKLHLKHCHLLLFADDLKIFRSVESLNDAFLLQADINNLFEWCSINYMHLNIKKCFSITFSKSNSCLQFNYSVNNEPLKQLKEVRDLGVTFDTKLCFNSHINNITMQSRKMLGFINRSAKNFSASSLKILYCSLVRSTLEYNSIIWSPFYDIYESKIEAVQHKFIRSAAFKMNINEYDYSEILRLLNLKTLTTRRIYASLTFLNSVISGHICCPDILELINFNVHPRATRNRELFSLSVHRTNYGHNSPISRMLRYGNEYNGLTDLFCTSNQKFKNSLKHLG